MNILQLKKVHIFSLLLLVICSMTVVCSSFDEEMMITGDAVIRIDEDVRIIDLQMNSTLNSAFETYNCSYSKNTTAMYITLSQLDSTITYKVTVQNKTDYVYIISNLKADINNTNITYTIDDYKVGEGMSSKDNVEFYITFKYKDTVKVLPSDKTAIVYMYYTFERPYAAILSYDNKESGSKCTDVQCALDDLYSILK